jgi:hypothetical protein
MREGEALRVLQIGVAVIGVALSSVLPAEAVEADHPLVLHISVDSGDRLTARRAASNRSLHIAVDGRGEDATMSQTLTLQAIPEPGTLALFGTGLVAIGVWGRRWLMKERHANSWADHVDRGPERQRRRTFASVSPMED